MSGIGTGTGTGIGIGIGSGTAIGSGTDTYRHRKPLPALVRPPHVVSLAGERVGSREGFLVYLLHEGGVMTPKILHRFPVCHGTSPTADPPGAQRPARAGAVPRS